MEIERISFTKCCLVLWVFYIWCLNIYLDAVWRSSATRSSTEDGSNTWAWGEGISFTGQGTPSLPPSLPLNLTMIFFSLSKLLVKFPLVQVWLQGKLYFMILLLILLLWFYLDFFDKVWITNFLLHSMFKEIDGWKFLWKILLVGREFPSFESWRESCLSAAIAFLV